jgi:signal peptide peptidase SppA
MQLPLDVFWSIFPPSLNSALASIREAKLPTAAMVDERQDEIRLPISMQENGIAVVSLLGPMMRNGGWIADLLGFASTDRVRLAVETAAKDPNVKQIVLRVDSPGGSVSGLAELGDAILAAREQKSVIAYVDGMAASAAYYAASQAEKIYAGRTDMVGSIGTILALYDDSKWFEANGIKPVMIATAEMKTAGYPGVEITDEMKAEFQRIVDFYFDDFLSVVTRGRGITKAQAKANADGNIWGADEAKERGLIDGIRKYGEAPGIKKAPQSRTRVKAAIMGAVTN